MICLPGGAGESQSPLLSSCSGEVDESSIHITASPLTPPSPTGGEGKSGGAKRDCHALSGSQ
jgi:hypothetical protein